MTILEIVLLIIGLGLCIGSFFVSEKLSAKDKENLTKLTREQIEEIIRDKMADAKVETEDKLSATIDEAMEELDRRTDKETNEKILQISQYSDTVLEAVDKSHKEVTFMYSMLNEKHDATVEMTKKLAELEGTLRALDSSVAKKLDLLRDRELEFEEDKRKLEELRQELENEKNRVTEERKSAEDKINMVENISLEEALSQKFTEENKTVRNDNMEILTLSDEGLSEVEIAKKLGRGLGEVKFVLGLYQEAGR